MKTEFEKRLKANYDPASNRIRVKTDGVNMTLDLKKWNHGK